MKIPPLIDKILRNALVVDDHYFFRCEHHGSCENPYKATEPTCEECQTIVFFIRDVMANEKRTEPGHLETLERAVSNACQAERAGSFDFRAYKHAKIEVNEDDVDDPKSRIILAN